MIQDMLEKTTFVASRGAPVEGIRLVKSMYYIGVAECTFNIHVGLFFDGTGNNYYRDKKDFSHTNVARLFDAYLDLPDDGLYRIYVPGVGTIFPEIGELEESPKKGGGLGWGCEQRILFGLLAVLNSIHQRAFGINNLMFTEDQIRILCTRSTARDEQELAILRPLGMAQGLMSNDTPQMLLKHLVRQLADKLNDPANKVKVGECMIDVFGFSRGAAQARVFCNWLQQILSGGKLAGVIVQIRFVGLFDTVTFL